MWLYQHPIQQFLNYCCDIGQNAICLNNLWDMIASILICTSISLNFTHLHSLHWDDNSPLDCLRTCPLWIPFIGFFANHTFYCRMSSPNAIWPIFVWLANFEAMLFVLPSRLFMYLVNNWGPKTNLMCSSNYILLAVKKTYLFQLYASACLQSI